MLSVMNRRILYITVVYRLRVVEILPQYLEPFKKHSVLIKSLFMARYSRCYYGPSHSDNSYITLKNAELIAD